MGDILKILRDNSELKDKITQLENFLNENQQSLHQTTYNGIIIQHKGIEYFKYSIEGQFSEEFPSGIEGIWVLCDEHGNTDFYQ